MIKKITVLAAALALIITSAAACATNDQQVSAQSSQADKGQVAAQSSQQTDVGANGVGQGDEGRKPNEINGSVENQKQIENEVRKMKEKGLIDENGRPAPGVDLNDIPALG